MCVGERYNRSGKRLLLRVDGGTVSVPPQWTDLVSPAPEVVMGQGRALFLVGDLLELASLVTRLCREQRHEAHAQCKENNAAIVKEITPQRR